MLNALYDRLPIWGQHLAVSAYGWHLRRRRYSGQFAQRVAWWRQVQQLSREERDLLLTRRLRTILGIAIDHTLYGEQLAEQYGVSADNISHWTDIRQLPILERDEVRANPARFRHRTLRSREVVERWTSGTTGSPMQVAVSLDALRDSYALLAIAEGWAGLSAKVRKASFNARLVAPVGQSTPPYWRYNRPGRQMLFSAVHLSPPTVHCYARQLSEYRPEYIDGYPSILYTVARMSLAQGLPLPSPLAIRTRAEKLYDFQRDVIEAAFRAPIFDWYGLDEGCCYAAQCKYGNYHVFDEYGIIEIVKDGEPVKVGEEGDVVATSLTNCAMPLVRYRVGDRAVRGPDECPCGHCSTILRSVTGRSDDVLITPEGRFVSGILSGVLQDASGVAEAQTVQNTVAAIRVDVIPEGQFGPEEQNALEAKLRQRLGPTLEIEFRTVAQIPRTAAGKYKLVESSLNMEDYLSRSTGKRDS